MLVALALTACGVDGEPVQPSGGVNVTLSNNGLGLGANVGVVRGPVSVGLGL
ncbi:hypothetical protein Z949_501 [Sulfitobacter guttiformis KCTC 32187]|uniref:Uncharacterized protein n=2 Tax=Sulfitobacter guttiformis TaxID=74349 RepID=A0A420DUF7_9RHOB|nr:hypothetical protein Z949_501 [Sulfitobacter guttiformis KCTC 32187]RKE97789.1 hypothetical protein C8N30_2418 [Sulfitobacter guttiformis]